MEGYPTLLLFPAGDKTPVSFEGSRDLASLKQFLQTHAKVPFTLHHHAEERTDL